MTFPTTDETGPLQESGFKKIDVLDDSRARVSQMYRRRDASLDLAGYVDHVRARVLQDALTEAMRSYWLRRADSFASVGTRRCDAIALACRRHAEIVQFQDVAILDDLLEEAM